MTVSDLIMRLQNAQKAVGSGATVRIAKELDKTDNTFEFFEVRKQEKEIILMPTSIWDRKKHD